jgi:hypothetical protein
LQIEIIRSASSSNATGTFGRMQLDGADFCATCEQPWNDNQEGHSCIPVGTYELMPYLSPAHGPTVVFHNPALGIYGWPALIPAGQSGRSLCEIHPANWPFQLKGCVAVGQELTDIPPNGMGVTHSVATFQLLAAKWGDRESLCAVISNGP